jgi:hypothetical protein
MTEPALRLFDNHASEETAVYRWTFPGAPIRIDIRLEVVRRLRVATKGRPFEIGGVLLGHSRSPRTIEIVDYRLIPCETNPTRGYLLNTSALEALRSKHSLSSDEKASVVGYFRTQQEQRLALRDGEMDVIRRHFNNPNQVVLLIQASPEQSTAGFLFWDGDVLNPFSFMDFPLDAELLRSEDTMRSSEPESNEPSRPAVIEQSIVNQDLVEQVKAAVEKKERHGLLRRSLTAVSAAVVVVAALLAFLNRDRIWRAPKQNPPAAIQVAPAPPASLPFQMEVEARGNGLDVRWNSHSPPVTQALEGRLVIMERGQDPQVISLNPEQLTSGHVYYQSSPKQLELRLEVVDSSGQVAKESVLVLASNEAGKVQTIPVVRSVADTLRAANEKVLEAPHSNGPPARSFTLPPLRQADPAEGRTVLLDPPAPIQGASPTVSSALIQQTSNRIAALPIRPPLPPPAPRAAIELKPAQISALRYDPPVPKKKATPILQPATAALIPQDAKIEIMIRVQIDQEGRVVGARAVPQSDASTGKSAVYSLLEKAGVDAAMLWEFEPARRGDKKVPSDHEVVFLFQHRPH